MADHALEDARLGERPAHEVDGRRELVDVLGEPQPVGHHARRYDHRGVRAQRVVVDALDALRRCERRPPLVAEEGYRLLTPQPGEEVHRGALLGEPALVVVNLRLEVVALDEYRDLRARQRAVAEHEVSHRAPP